jgi:hypothetical protein
LNFPAGCNIVWSGLMIRKVRNYFVERLGNPPGSEDIKCGSNCHPVQPRRDGPSVPDAAGVCGECHEHSLTGILGSIAIPSQHPTTDSPHHCPVSPDQKFECGLIP